MFLYRGIAHWGWGGEVATVPIHHIVGQLQAPASSELTKDPYSLINEWTESPESVPDAKLSNMLVGLVAP